MKKVILLAIACVLGMGQTIFAQETAKDVTYVPDETQGYLLNRFKDKSDNIKEIIYRIVNDINEKPKCPCCGNPLPFLGRPGRLYRDYCSKKCSNSSFSCSIYKYSTRTRLNSNRI